MYQVNSASLFIVRLLLQHTQENELWIKLL